MVRKWMRAGDYFLPLFFVSLALKIVYAYLYYTLNTGFNGEIANAALSIYRGNGIADIFEPGSGPSAHVAPVYAYYLAGLLWLFGNGPAWSLASQLGSLVAASASVALLPALARASRMPVGVGIGAAVFLALSPFAASYEKYAQWESAFAALGLLLCFGALARLEQTDRSVWLKAAAAGGLSGLLALLSPAMAPGILGCAFASGIARGASLLRSGLAFGVALLSCALVVAPWSYRNYCVLGGLVPVRSNFGLELYVGNHAGANGFTYSTTEPATKDNFNEWHPAVSRKELDRYEEAGELAYVRERGGMAFSWIRQNPDAFLRLTLRRFQIYWFPLAGTGTPAARALWFALLGIGSFCGAIYLVRVRHPLRWHYWSVLFGPSLVYMVAHVDLRYRYPTVWVSALLTVYVAAAVAGALFGPRRGADLGAVRGNP
jgi:hypothetical protein